MISRVAASVSALLSVSPSFAKLAPEKKRQLSEEMVKVGGYLAEPEGHAANRLPGGIAFVPAMPAAMEDFLDEVNFPAFVAALIQGVFQAVVSASIEQMEAYAELLKNAAATVDKFRREAISDDAGRDWLTTAYPDVIERDEAGCLRLRKGISPEQAIRRLMLLGIEGGLGPVAGIDKILVAAGRRNLAKERQQLLATMVLMGSNG